MLDWLWTFLNNSILPGNWHPKIVTFRNPSVPTHIFSHQDELVLLTHTHTFTSIPPQQFDLYLEWPTGIFYVDVHL